ncbi:MAG: Ribonuclease [Candidatus Parcubacteria bacterium]|jgi:ribonuclease P protein component
MLPKARRIDKTTFKTLNGRGMSYHSPLLFLSLYKQNEVKPSRFAVLCSKKVSAKAVDRNRQRRRVYRSLQNVLFTIKPGYFGILSLKKEAKESTFTELDMLVKNLLKQAGLID